MTPRDVSTLKLEVGPVVLDAMGRENGQNGRAAVQERARLAGHRGGSE